MNATPPIHTPLIGSLLISAVLALAGCSNAQPQSSPDPQFLGTWHLVLATDHGATIASGAEDITLTIADSEHSGGASPCSQYRASVTGGPGAVFVDASFRGHNIRCTDPGLARIDNQYLDALAAASYASIDGGVLVLSSPHSSLVYLKPALSSTGTLQNTRWALVLPPDLRASTSVHLTFGDVGQLTITTSCGTTVAHYRLVEDIIILRDVVATPTGTKACTPADRIARAILSGQLTADVSSATIAGPATLILTNRANEEPLLWRSN